MKIFLSYTSTKDHLEKVSDLRKRLEAEICIRDPGSNVFQDKHNIQEGDHFPDVLATELAKSDVLLVLVSPAWLRSEWCRHEFSLFTDDGANTDRVRRILPVLWVDTPDMHHKSVDSVAQNLASIHYADWRELRYGSWDDPASQKEIGKLAERAVCMGNHPAAIARTLEPRTTLEPRPTGELAEFMIRLLPGYQPWTEIDNLKFRREYTLATDPVLDVMVENKSSSPIVFHRVGIRMLRREPGIGVRWAIPHPCQYNRNSRSTVPTNGSIGRKPSTNEGGRTCPPRLK